LKLFSPLKSSCFIGMMFGLVISLSACSKSNESEPVLQGTIDVQDQETPVDNQITINRIESHGPGWVLIFETQNDTPGIELGREAVPTGLSENIYFQLKRNIITGEQLIAKLYADAGMINLFEPSGEDKLIHQTQAFTVTPSLLSQTAPDVRLKVKGISTSIYQWTVMDSGGETNLLGTQLNNQDLLLKPGLRYEIINETPTQHPFAILGTEQVLLSQSERGSYELDNAVAWREQGNIIQFTLTDELAKTIDTYKCSIHPGMTGSMTAYFSSVN